MTTIAYLDCPSGLAGDMCLGALVHAGVPLGYIDQALRTLGIKDDYTLTAESLCRNGQQATKVHVRVKARLQPSSSHLHSHHSSHGDESSAPSDHDSPSHPYGQRYEEHPESHHQTHGHSHARHLPEIEHLIQSANLPTRAREWSLAIFRRLAEAEGAVHGIAPERVHFHEVGATDAIVDIVGTCLGLDWLGIDQLYCSALPTGGGTVWAAHGRLPVPVPAVLKLWEMRQVPIYSNGIEQELVTPTGAAIATTLAVRFGLPPAMTLRRVGLGAGSRELRVPNILRLWIGEASPSGTLSARPDAFETPSPAHHLPSQGRQTRELSHLNQEDSNLDRQPSHPTVDADRSPSLEAQDLSPQLTQAPVESIAVLETQIDDLNPQIIGYVFESLFQAGALDVFTQPVGMKKCRPGILLTVICHPEQASACELILFQETTTIGIRRREECRTVLYREIQQVHTEYGNIRLKIARSFPDGPVLNVQPEYEDCARVARQQHIPWHRVHRAALQARWLAHDG